MSERYIISDHVELLEEDGYQVLLHQVSGQVLQVNQDVVDLIQFLHTERNHDDMKAFFTTDVPQEEAELLEEVQGALDLLHQYSLIKTIEG